MPARVAAAKGRSGGGGNGTRKNDRYESAKHISLPFLSPRSLSFSLLHYFLVRFFLFLVITCLVLHCSPSPEVIAVINANPKMRATSPRVVIDCNGVARAQAKGTLILVPPSVRFRPMDMSNGCLDLFDCVCVCVCVCVFSIGCLLFCICLLLLFSFLLFRQLFPFWYLVFVFLSCFFVFSHSLF